MTARLKYTVKSIVLVLLAAALAFCALPAQAATADFSQVVSDAWLVMDAATGQLLAAQNPDKTKYPASITKILTLALTLENGNLDDTLTVSQEAVDVGYDTAHIALQPGEIITVRDAVMATLLASANDAANCLAEYVSGSNTAFAALMNQKLAQLGCTGTHFTNPSGLPDDNHYTTPRDMAKITAWALTVPGFREIFADTFYTMPVTNKQPEQRSWGTQNAMIVTSAFTYEGAWGGKLGWTEEARHTMVTTLTRDGRDLILVTMDSSHKYQKYRDGIAILDACFDQLQLLQLDDTVVGAVSAPMYSDTTLLGNVPFVNPGLALWVPKGTAASDLTLSWQLPEKLQVGDTTPATLQVSIPGGSCLPETSLSVQVPQGSLSGVQTTWQSLRAEQYGAAAWQGVHKSAVTARRWRTVGIVALVLVGLVLLAFCVRWYNLARRNLRRYGSLFKPRRAKKQGNTRPRD